MNAIVESELHVMYSQSPSCEVFVTGSLLPDNAGIMTTAVFSGRVRRTPTDARALLTRKIQEIQKIHSSSVATVVDTGIGSNGLSETSLARMSSFLARRAYFGGLGAPAHPRLLECRARGIKFS